MIGDVLNMARRGGGGVGCFFLMIRRPPRSTLDRSSAASDVYKRQEYFKNPSMQEGKSPKPAPGQMGPGGASTSVINMPVSYTHLRAHETVLDLVCRLLLEKKNHANTTATMNQPTW